jgi:AcrR family transcriptional regulator
MAMPTATKRPRDRARHIADAAAALFAARGYHQVTLDDVATEVGITGRAIYRHFENKQALLAGAVLDRLGRLEAAASADDDVAAMADVVLRHRDTGVLLEREARHLEPGTQGDVAGRLDALRNRLAADRFVGRAALAVLLSASHHGVVPTDEDTLAARAAAALGAAPAPVPASPAPMNGRTAPRASRREAVLAAAVELFARNGYADTRMEDVGRAAGIAGPSIYEHFESKGDLLMAALRRGAEWLQLGITSALAAGGGPSESLRAVVVSYVDFMADHTDLFRVLLHETVNLGDDDRHALRRVQHEYVAEWVRALSEVQPLLDPPTARFVTHGALAVVNDHALTPAGGDHRDGLVDLALAVLLSGGAWKQYPYVQCFDGL